MFGLFAYKPLLSETRVIWIRDMWSVFQKKWANKRDEIILPHPGFYLAPESLQVSSEEEFVRYYADKTCKHMGIPEFQYKVEPHASGNELDHVLSSFGETKSDSPGGMYWGEEDGIPLITYNPSLLERPVDLISMLAHEISHHIMRVSEIEIIGGPEFEEYATDLCAVYHGMGVFLLRSSIRMDSWMDNQRSGWSVVRAGYLSIPEFAYSLALYSKVNQCNNSIILDHLGDSHYNAYKKAIKQIEREPFNVQNVK